MCVCVFLWYYSPYFSFVLLRTEVSWSHTYRHTVGLLWTSDQPVAETSTYTGQHDIETQQTNIHAPSGIPTGDPSNQTAADLRLRPRGHWDRHTYTYIHLWRRRWETMYSSYSFTTSALDGCEWPASRPGRALPPGKEPPVPIVQEAGLAPGPVWTHRLEEKSLASAVDRTSIARSSSPQPDTILTELPRLHTHTYTHTHTHTHTYIHTYIYTNQLSFGFKGLVNSFITPQRTIRPALHAQFSVAIIIPRYAATHKRRTFRDTGMWCHYFWLLNEVPLCQGFSNCGSWTSAESQTSLRLPSFGLLTRSDTATLYFTEYS
jgi:hypothetical protein